MPAMRIAPFFSATHHLCWKLHRHTFQAVRKVTAVTLVRCKVTTIPWHQVRRIVLYVHSLCSGQRIGVPADSANASVSLKDRASQELGR